MSLGPWQLGGFTITRAGWTGPHAVRLDFVAAPTGHQFQLYANRTLIGTTDSPSERSIVGLLPPSEIPAPLTLIRVDRSQVLHDFGPELPPVPWNRFRLRWSTAGFPADTDHVDIVASPAAGEPYDPANIVAGVPWLGDGDYQYELPPIGGGGTWQFAAIPRDDAKPLGNAGTPAIVSIVARVPPPDVAEDEDGQRFSLAAVGGELTATFAYGAPL